MKNAFDVFISKLDVAKKTISELANISTDYLKTEKQKGQLKRIELNIQELWDNYKSCNIYIMGIYEREEKNNKKHLKR